MMKYFQRLGKSLMLPVACLPVCGILMGIGYILAPAAMAGEVAGFTAGGLSYTIGLFLIKAGSIARTFTTHLRNCMFFKPIQNLQD